MHHSRRKSGHGLPNTSMTDVRKAAAATGDASGSSSRHRSSKHASNSNGTSTSRRSGGGSQPTTRHSKSTTTSSRDAEPTFDEDYWYDDERESFPQFCMTCDKQFVTKDDRLLYCSEACRDYDQQYGASISTQHFKDSYANHSSSSRTYSVYYNDNTEPRDIIPRAAPSRPSSTYFSLPTSSAAAGAKASVSASTAASTSSSAIAALRSLSLRDASPPSPPLPSSASGIWPFSHRSTAASPSTSYGRPSGPVYAATYDQGYYRTGAPNYYAPDAGQSSAGLGTERPLPIRRPGSYSRPKSIELVTPLLGQ
ncbi:hypothetical protein SPI_00176 [Niveomyces insectorum RCEF 264]|uniref:Life-span regulatory factor n=1 Tax=Niveomyces insectorum RCEF 264 TaxID=1081102 RepID=A0A167ZWJ1_9HYPO|nr:hypothetical protein SPI_00176 [Niveomyces insectorum RCEF 264]